jgi:Uma2 family endonuclease
MSAVLTRPENRTARVDNDGRFLWTREAFLEALSRGDFGVDNKIELLRGEVYFKMTMKSAHATSLALVQDALREIFGVGWIVRSQVPLLLNEDDFPEPDLAVVEGTTRNYANEHPRSALLIVEVADATLAKDRTIKAAIYAEAGIADYWILNLNDRVLEIYRQPAPMQSEPFGFGYRSITRYSETDEIAPLAAPQHPISVAALLP